MSFLNSSHRQYWLFSDDHLKEIKDISRVRSLNELRKSIAAFPRLVEGKTKSQLVKLGVESLFTLDDVAGDQVPLATAVDMSTLKLEPLTQEEEELVMHFYIHRMYILQTCLNSVEYRQLPYSSPPTLPYPDEEYILDDSDSPPLLAGQVKEEPSTDSSTITVEAASNPSTEDPPASVPPLPNDSAVYPVYVHKRLERKPTQGSALVLPDSTLLTAIHLFTRLFAHHSVTTVNPKLAMVACLFIAGKIDENFLRVEDLSRFEYVDPRDVTAVEGQIIERCGFDLYIALPHRAKRGLLEQFMKDCLPALADNSDNTAALGAMDATEASAAAGTALATASTKSSTGSATEGAAAAETATPAAAAPAVTAAPVPVSAALRATEILTAFVASLLDTHPLSLRGVSRAQLALSLSRLSRRADALLVTCSGDILLQYTHSQLAAAALLLACCDYLNCGSEVAVAAVAEVPDAAVSTPGELRGSCGAVYVDGLALHAHAARVWNSRADAVATQALLERSLAAEQVWDTRTVEAQLKQWPCAARFADHFFLSSLPLTNPYQHVRQLNLPPEESNSVPQSPSASAQPVQRLREALSLAHSSLAQRGETAPTPSTSQSPPLTPFSCPLAIPLAGNLRFLSALPYSPETTSASVSVAALLPFPAPDATTLPVAALVYGYVWRVLGLDVLPTDSAMASTNPTFARVIRCSARMFAQHVTHLAFQYNLNMSLFTARPLRSTLIPLPVAELADMLPLGGSTERPLVRYSNVRARSRVLLGVHALQQQWHKDRSTEAWESKVVAQQALQRAKRAAEQAALLGEDGDTSAFILPPTKRGRADASPAVGKEDPSQSTAFDDNASTDDALVSRHIGGPTATPSLSTLSVGLTPALRRQLRMSTDESDTGNPADAISTNDTVGGTGYVKSLLVDSNPSAPLPPLPTHTGTLPASMKVEFLDAPPPDTPFEVDATPQVPVDTKRSPLYDDEGRPLDNDGERPEKRLFMEDSP